MVHSELAVLTSIYIHSDFETRDNNYYTWINRQIKVDSDMIQFQFIIDGEIINNFYQTPEKR